MASNVPSIDDSATNDDNIIEDQVKFIHQWTQSSDKDKQVVIVTAGKAGVGKSTLINNFLELEGDAAFEARLDPHSVTTTVDHCDRVINGVQIRLIDMPGLHPVDLEHRVDKKENIIGDLKGLVDKGVDVVFYCFNLLNRLENVDLENLDTLTQVFGSEIWNRAIFVFTYTDVVMSNGSSPEELVGKYIEALRNHLVVKRKVNVEIRSNYSFPADMCSKDAEIDTFNGIVGIPVSKDPAIPPKWRMTLLLQVIKKCRKENIPAFLKLNHINWHEVAKTTAIVAAGGLGGAAIGTAVGAGVGALVGGVLTAPIGGVGAIPTAAGGAAVGAWIGTISGSVPIGLSSGTARIAYVIYSRFKIERRAHRKTKEMVLKELKLAHKASGASQDDAQL